MKKLRIICWVWIAVATVAVLLFAPIKVSYKNGSEEATQIEWAGPFTASFSGYKVKSSLSSLSNRWYVSTSWKQTKSSPDIPRLAIALLLASFLPVVMIRNSDSIGEWFLLYYKKAFVFLRRLVVFAILMVIIGYAATLVINAILANEGTKLTIENKEVAAKLKALGYYVQEK